MAFFSFLSWFKPWWKTTETDYETVLSRLTKDITGVQERLVRISQRERRSSIHLTLYAVLIWLVYSLFVYISTIDERLEMNKLERIHLWLPSVIGLVVIISVRSIVRWWFKHVSEGEEKHLRSLQRARRKKIDEIKQATKFDHLRSLLERYDDTGSNKPGIRRGGSGLDVKQKQSQNQQSNNLNRTNSNGLRQFQGRKDGRLVNEFAQQSLKPPSSENIALPTTPIKQQNSSQGQPPLPKIVTGTGSELPFEQPQQHLRFQKTWLDRVADKILGVESSATPSEQRYALICHVCLSHNGLCPKEEWEEVQYICPRCGTFNSRRPSTVPVTSPWSNSPQYRRASLGDTSPARSLRDLPGSPSVKSMLMESVSAPSGLGNSSLAEGDDDEDEDEDEDEEELVEKESDEAVKKDVSEDEEERSQDPGNNLLGVEQAIKRGNGRTTARKEDNSDIRKRQTVTITDPVGDESTEPMQID